MGLFDLLKFIIIIGIISLIVGIFLIRNRSDAIVETFQKTQELGERINDLQNPNAEKKTPYTERSEDELLDEITGLGEDPTTELLDGKLSTMKAVRDNTVIKQTSIKSRLKAAQESFGRLRGEREQLKKKLDQLKEEFNNYPDDESVGDELAQCDEDLEEKERELLQAEADVKILKDYDYRMSREVAALSDAIRKCEAQGEPILTASEYDSLKNDLESAHGASSSINQLRRNADSRTMDVSSGVKGEKARKRERLEKFRNNNTQE
ncbi:hypothetical protein IKW72_08640 [bacterium]|nr:hypothetical protein [bacterium]